MILHSKNVWICEDRRFNHPAITFTFIGNLTKEAIVGSTGAWKAYLNGHPNNKYILVWDCLEMETIEMEARREWIKQLQIFSNRIEQVIVITDSMVIRKSAHKILKLFKFKSDIYPSLEEGLSANSAYPELVAVSR